MRKLLLATTAVAVLFILPAQAATVLHLSSTGGVDNPTQDPALITSNTQFFVDNVSGQSAAGPTTLFFATAGAAPTLSSVFLRDGISTAVTFGAVTDTGLHLSAATSDLYSVVGLGAANNSINWTNITTAFNANFGSIPLALEIYRVTLNSGIGGQEFFEVNGTFGQGTVIAPYVAPDLFTSWTNTGVITTMTAVPEVSTWAMMLLGFLSVGVFGASKRRGFRFA